MNTNQQQTEHANISILRASTTSAGTALADAVAAAVDLKLENGWEVGEILNQLSQSVDALEAAERLVALGNPLDRDDRGRKP